MKYVVHQLNVTNKVFWLLYLRWRRYALFGCSLFIIVIVIVIIVVVVVVVVVVTIINTIIITIIIIVIIIITISGIKLAYLLFAFENPVAIMLNCLGGWEYPPNDVMWKWFM